MTAYIFLKVSVDRHDAGVVRVNRPVGYSCFMDDSRLFTPQDFFVPTRPTRVWVSVSEWDPILLIMSPPPLWKRSWSLPYSPFFLRPDSHQRLLAPAQDHQLRGGEGSGSHQREDAAAAGHPTLRRQPQLPQQGAVLGGQRHGRPGEHQQRRQHPVKAGGRRHLGGQRVNVWEGGGGEAYMT